MYHEPSAKTNFFGYYDTIEEIPTSIKVVFSDEDRKSEEMDVVDLMKLTNEGYFAILHSCNYGSCDHWTAESISKWINKKYVQIYCFKDNGNVIGYTRPNRVVHLTKDPNYHKSEVWNS